MNVVLVYRGRYLIREALDLEPLANVLRGAGHSLSFVYEPDTFGVTDNVFQLPALARLLADDRRTVARILDARPDVVLFSVLSSTYAWCRQIATAVKAADRPSRPEVAGKDARRGVPTVFFGLHPSLVPERVMRDPCVDYVIAGEVEGVIRSLLEAIGTGQEVSAVGNLWYRDGGSARFTRRAELVDLDALPLPDKELFAPYVSHRYSYSAMVSRGCPYRCTFCEETCSKKLYGGRYFRRKAVDTVLRELVAGKRRYRYREVIFKDSYLSGDRKWLRDLMDGYRREIGVPFKCFCTITSFDEETARLLKEGGCYCIEFGLQTWNDRLRREVLDRRETGEDALRAFAECDRVGLWYDVDHMFNLPTETEEDHREGAAQYRRLRRLNRVKVHFLVYYPTADIVDHAIAAGDVQQDARERLAEGEASDFYNQTAANARKRKMVASYAALYKILPMLPGPAVGWLSAAGRVKYLRWIPGPLMGVLQALNALRSGDLRFATYAFTYPRKVLHSLWAAVPWGRSAVCTSPQRADSLPGDSDAPRSDH